MIYTITVLNVTNAVPTGASGVAQFSPWTQSGGAVSFTNPTLTTIAINDDDDQFNSGLYSGTETGQTLTAPATFGTGASAITVPAGTKLANFNGTILQDSDGAQFISLFPFQFDAGKLGTLLGGKTSVLIVPLPRIVNGATVYGTFNPTRSYINRGIQQASRTDDTLAYAPPPPPPPPAPAPCFVEGTLILTATGARPVQDLRPGDLLATLDDGWQPVLWTGHRLSDLDLRPQDRPIGIARGALGPGSPARDLAVSPQHRMLVRSRVAQRMTGASEMLVAARHLIGHDGIRVLTGDPQARYWHILMPRHQIISAHGAWTESLYPGKMALMAFDPAQRAQIRALLPDLDANPPAFARPVPKGHQARQLILRHVRNARPLIDA